MKVAKGLLHQGLRRGDIVSSIGVDGPNSLLLFIAASSFGIIFTVSKKKLVDVCQPNHHKLGTSRRTLTMFVRVVALRGVENRVSRLPQT